MNVDVYVTPEAQADLRAHIADAGGNEVCFVGEVDRSMRVVSVRVLARGHDTAVNALTHLARPGDVIIHNHPGGEALVPSDADLDIAGRLGDAGIASFIVDNAVREIYVIVEPIPAKALRPLDVADLSAYLGPDGHVGSVLSGYEDRPQQRQMLECVGEAFNENRIAMIEAGTGTGKTLAYLIPALIWALQNRERVVVSTNTINLQEQLLHKDLPVVRRALGRDFKAVLVKGRSNYVCKRKAELQRQQAELFTDDEQRNELITLLEWAAQTDDGSRSDLNFTPRDETWELMQSDTDTSLRTRCLYYESCFYHSARREANTADVLVVNHSLLLADLALRAQTGNYTDLGVLPRYDRIILDEAHHLEDVATKFFGARTSGAALRRVLRRILRTNRRGQPHGAIEFVRRTLASGPGARANTDAIHRYLDEEVLPAHAAALDAMPDLWQATEDFLRTVGEGTGRERQWTVPRPEAGDAGVPAEVCDTTNRFCRKAGVLVTRLLELAKLLDDENDTVADALLPCRTEVRAQAGRLEVHLATLQRVLSGGEENEVCWLTLRQGRREPVVAWELAPVEVGPTLATSVFDRFGTVVLSSATLAVDGDFGFLERRLGLDRVAAPDRVRTLALASPFAFAEQMAIGLPADLPQPNQGGYETALATSIQEAVHLTGGRALVLFTSFKALDAAFGTCQPAFEAAGIRTFRQGDEPRDVLLRRFREDETSVLFAVDSFWEGIDVSGNALRNVIICKLPFRVPTDPVFAARSAAIEARGGSAFIEYHVPLAVLRVKQGVGRLIRCHTDSGCVVILDSRAVTKPYGRAFRSALPPGHVETGPWAEVLAGLRRFLAPFSAAAGRANI